MTLGEAIGRCGGLIGVLLGIADTWEGCSMRHDVRAWATERSYRSDSWTAAGLLGEKGGVRVSVVLPARDEADTVGSIVAAIRDALVVDVPLVDEIVVLDSHSSDETAAVARAARAVVHHQAEVLPDLGDRTGKGEALWKALHVTTGDVIAYVDADLRDFDPQFIVSLLGPLLTDAGVDRREGVLRPPAAHR